MSILKLGGSLLNLPDVSDRLVSFIDQCQIANPVVVVGGGHAADLVRTWADRFKLCDPVAHNLALQAMTLNAQLLSHLHTRFELVSAPLHANAVCPPQQISILQSQSAIAIPEAKLPKSQQVPRSWDVTSDSIAAWLATCWKADRLFLLKSTDLPGDVLADQPDSDTAHQQRSHFVRDLTQRGLVDHAFAMFSQTIPSLTWCNLRDWPAELRSF
jgi:5-(aminomethyl)-3-furanmethanol phosphate kinase